MSRLTKQESLFVASYLKDYDIIKAHEAAGYPSSTPQAREFLSLAVFNRPSVQEAITERLSAKTASKEEILYRLTEQSRNIYAAYFSANGTFDLGKMIAEGKAHLIKSIKPSLYGNVIEFMDGQRALELLGKHHKLFTDRVETVSDVLLRVEYAEDIEDGKISNVLDSVGMDHKFLGRGSGDNVSNHEVDDED